MSKAFKTQKKYAEKNIGIFRGMTEIEKLNTLTHFKKQILEFNSKGWSKFLSFRKTGDKIYKFPSESEKWWAGAGYIIVRNGQIIAVHYLFYE